MLFKVIVAGGECTGKTTLVQALPVTTTLNNTGLDWLVEDESVICNAGILFTEEVLYG